jgi:hypothetical protein
MGVTSKEALGVRSVLADGIFGMAFEGLARINKPPAFEQLQQQTGIASMFAFYLTKQPGAPGSILTLGGYDQDLLRENDTWRFSPVVNVVPYDFLVYWAVKITAATFTYGNSAISDGASIASQTSPIDVCSEGCMAMVAW